MPENSPDSLDDVSNDLNVYSFVVRVWREDPTSEEEKDIWRGHVTPIPEGVRHYFIDFNEIPAFIQDYLKSMK